MKINAVKTKYKVKPFFKNGKFKASVKHADGKLLAFVIEHKNVIKEFKVKYTKTNVFILDAFKKLEKYIATIK